MRSSIALWLASVALVACGDTPMAQSPEPLAGPTDVTPATGPSSSPSAAPSATAPTPSPVDGLLPAAIAASPMQIRFDGGTNGCKPVPIEELAKKLPAKAPLVVFEAQLGDRGCLSVPKDEGLEVAAVVLSGKARVEADGTKAPLALDGAWAAFRAPGAGLAIRGIAAARVLITIVQTNGQEIVGRKPGKVWSKRSFEPTLAKLDASPDLAWGKGAYHARIGFSSKAGDTPALALDSLLISADANVAEHAHPNEWECLAVLEGDGDLVVKGEGPDQHLGIEPGAIRCVPKGRPHLTVHGKSKLVAVQIYTPAGPEQRFVKLANP